MYNDSVFIFLCAIFILVWFVLVFCGAVYMVCLYIMFMVFLYFVWCVYIVFYFFWIFLYFFLMDFFYFFCFFIYFFDCIFTNRWLMFRILFSFQFFLLILLLIFIFFWLYWWRYHVMVQKTLQDYNKVINISILCGIYSKVAFYFLYIQQWKKIITFTSDWMTRTQKNRKLIL